MKRRVVSVLLVFCTLFVLLGTMGQKKEWHMTQNEVVHDAATSTKETVVYYANNNWGQAYIHYCVDGGDWTTAPGVRMSESNEKTGYQWKYIIDLGTANSVQVCFNNGASAWDGKNGSHYLYAIYKCRIQICSL